MVERSSVASIVPSPDEMFFFLADSLRCSCGGVTEQRALLRCDKIKAWVGAILPQSLSTDRTSCNASHCTREDRSGVTAAVEAINQIGRRHRRISAEHPHEVSGKRGLLLPARPPPSGLIEIHQRAGYRVWRIFSVHARARRRCHQRRNNDDVDGLHLAAACAGGTSSAGLRSKKLNGRNRKPCQSPGIAGQSSARGTWGKPMVYQRTRPLPSID